MTSFEFAGNREGEPAVDTVQIAGPYNASGPGDTASRRRIFVCRPAAARDEERCARITLVKDDIAAAERSAGGRFLQHGDVLGRNVRE